MFRKTTTLLFAAALGAPLGYAQFDFTVDGKAVQIHSFAQQGFAYSNENNFLSMDTSQGSFADFGTSQHGGEALFGADAPD